MSTGQLGPALQQFGVSPAAVEAANKVNVYCICSTVVIENVKWVENITLTVVVKGDVRAFAEAMEKDETEKRTGDEQMQTD